MRSSNCSAISLLIKLTLLTGAAASVGAQHARAEERDRMVDDTIVGRGMSESAVIRSMRSVPRHLFVPEAQARRAYDDRPLPIGHGQTISQPFIVAYMTEMLEIERGESVLEIGTGSAYQAAVLAEITDRVFSMEIIPELAESARMRLASIGYTDVRVRRGDGYFGWEEHAPFDAIIVTAAADHVPPPLIAQLAEGGVMIIPVGARHGVQTLIRIQKHQEGSISRDGLMYVRFVPFTREADGR